MTEYSRTLSVSSADEADTRSAASLEALATATASCRSRVAPWLKVTLPNVPRASRTRPAMPARVTVDCFIARFTGVLLVVGMASTGSAELGGT
jgi:hypothetical protein